MFDLVCFVLCVMECNVCFYFVVECFGCCDIDGLFWECVCLYFCVFVFV